MKPWIIAAVAVLAAPSAALACSCLYTENPKELRALAKEVAPNAVALVEAETTQTYAESNGAGDRMRIVRTLAGSAPAEFRVERGPFPSSASCDQLYEKGEQAMLILYAPSQPSAGEPTFRISGLCTTGLLQQAPYRDEVIRLMQARSSGERG